MIKEVNYVHNKNRLGVLLVPVVKQENYDSKDHSETETKTFKEVLNAINKSRTDNK